MTVTNDPAVDAGPGSLRLDHQLCFPLYAASNLLQRLYRPLLAPLGLTYSQYLVMLVLWERGPVHVGALRDHLHLDGGTVTPLVKRMEQSGLVRRRRDPADERRVIVVPTRLGLSLRKRAAAIPTALASRVEVDHAHAMQLHGLATMLVERLRNAMPEAQSA